MSDEPKALALTTTQGGPMGGGMVPSTLEQAMRLADLMCKTELVPVHLQEKPANCLMVIEVSMRWGMSPFAVAQCTSVIQGKMMYEGKLVAAVVNSRGELSKRLRYVYDGKGIDRTCTVIGTLRGEEEPREVAVTFGLVRTTNKCWDSQPDQQLAYHGARVWARRHLPEVMLGVYSPEEPFDVEVDIEPSPGAQLISAVKAEMAKRPKEAPSASDASPGDEVSAPSTDREPGADDDFDPAESQDMVECFRLVEEGNRKDNTYKCEWIPAGPRPRRSLAQNKKMHALWHQRGTTDAQRKEQLMRLFSKESSSDLSVDEADVVIAKLEQAVKLHGTAAEKTARKEKRGRQALEDVGTALVEAGVTVDDLIT